jgi:hypothetical protein
LIDENDNYLHTTTDDTDNDHNYFDSIEDSIHVTANLHTYNTRTSPSSHISKHQKFIPHVKQKLKREMKSLQGFFNPAARSLYECLRSPPVT